jgi:hypothetical protein
VFRVLATLLGGDISTPSDTVVVTTGLPQLRSLTLIPGATNIGGRNLIGSAGTTDVSVLLSDDFSNPVPDGTPVVFQTNIGAIGSSNRGGCNTVNGTCSVKFIVQNPLTATPGVPMTLCNTGQGSKPDSTRPGLATICASTTDGADFLIGKTTIFVSGEQPVMTTKNGTLVSFSTSAPNDLGSISAGNLIVFQLQINDFNNNPMPVGTKVDLTNAFNIGAFDASPKTVPNVVPHGASGDDSTGNTVDGPQGSIHTFSVGSMLCMGPGPMFGSFNVTVTTPAGTVTNIPFKVTFNCP